MNIENKLTDLERINSMVIVTCDACENGNDIKYDVANVMMLIEDQIDSWWKKILDQMFQSVML